MKNTYFDSHRDFKCNVMGGAFRISVEKGYDSADFVRKVMTSKKLDYLFKMDDVQEWCDDCYFLSILEYHLKFKKGKTKDPYFMWFAGYLYKYFLMRNYTRKTVYEVLPLKRLEAAFPFYHTQDWDYIIDDAIRVYITDSYRV